MLDLIHQSAFFELTAILLLATLLGYAGHVLKQPLIVIFIAVGVIAGPSLLGLVKSHDHIALLAELGITVLLFLVGLKLDVGLVRSLGKVALITGLGQVLFTSIVGFVIGIAMGLDMVTSIYVSVALTFSSTIIIVKLLTDKKEIDSLHGKIALGFLIVQDFVVVIAMLVITMLAGGEGQAKASITQTLVHFVLLAVLLYIFTKYLATPILTRISRSQELLILFGICWATLLTTTFDYLGLGKELGGLVAGVSLASTAFRETISSRLTSLRDFLLLFFFISIGTKFDLSLIAEQLDAAILFSLFVLIGNPLIVMIILGMMGYRKRTGLLAGLTVAQISEFSLIFIGMGIAFGHVQEEALSLVTFVGLATITASVYMINYSHWLYTFLEPALFVFEKSNVSSEIETQIEELQSQPFDVLLLGRGRYGTAIASNLLKKNKKVLVVDFDPQAVNEWRELGGNAIYGDVSDPGLLDELPLNNIAWIISTIPHTNPSLYSDNPNLTLLSAIREKGYKGKIGMVAHHEKVVRGMRAYDLDMILMPYRDAGTRAVEKMYPQEPSG